MPALLPGSQRLIFHSDSAERGQLVSEIRVLKIETGDQQVILKDARFARYFPTGHLIFFEGRSSDRVFIAPFDAKQLAVGSAVAVGQSVRLSGLWPALTLSERHAALPAHRGRACPHLGRSAAAVGGRVFSDGALGGTATLARRPPGGCRGRPDQGRPGIAVVDLDRGVVTPFAPEGRIPIWTPDGARITFANLLLDSLLWKPSDGSGTPETLYRTSGGLVLNDGSWTPDGRLTFTETIPDGSHSRAAVVLANEDSSWVSKRLDPLEDVRRAVDVCAARVSPDGRWVVYGSDASGTSEVWIQAFPKGGRRTQVSTKGGYGAIWSATGREISISQAGGSLRSRWSLSPSSE